MGDAALREDDDDNNDQSKIEDIEETVEELKIDEDKGKRIVKIDEEKQMKIESKKIKNDVAALTPATIINPAHDTPTIAKPVPRALGQAQTGDLKQLKEREGTLLLKWGISQLL